MQTVVTQRIGTQYPHYPKTEKKEAEKTLQNGAKFSANGEQTTQNFREILIDRENRLQFIDFLTKYLEDLKAGNPVENLSPSNDPYFLVPENIIAMIKAEKSVLNGEFRIINPEDIWKGI